MEKLLYKCLEAQKLVEIIYLSRGGDCTQRLIRVIEIKDEKVKAYCCTRMKTRTFKIDSILSATPK